MNKVEGFTLHNDRGRSILARQLSSWMTRNGKLEVFGPVVAYSWSVDGVEYKKLNFPPKLSLDELPDGCGFIAFEKGWKPDNCLLLDVYGNERMRLAVPWQLTRQKNPESAKPPTAFVRVSEPYINPADNKEGQFGVNAWVEHAGTYYFELDYHAGQFLWGREIRD